MRVYIYRITNNINGKTYIGKTINFQRRMTEHFSETSWEREPNKILYLAFKKYGKQNFTREILEITDEDGWVEKEIFWIEEYNSLGNGYNMIPGGTEPPHPTGEEHPMSKLTWKDVDKIIVDLKKGEMLKREIAIKYNISIDQILRINKGTSWAKDDEVYPISTITLDKEVVEEIKNLLENTQLKHIEIAEMFQISRTTVTAINRGQNHVDEWRVYPIRHRFQDAIDAKDLLINTNIPIYEINLLFNKSANWASGINQGRTHFDKDLKYPLRKT